MVTVYAAALDPDFACQVNAKDAGVGVNAGGCPIKRDPNIAKIKTRSFTIGSSASQMT
jgi:hypothetical protein